MNGLVMTSRYRPFQGPLPWIYTYSLIEDDQLVCFFDMGDGFLNGQTYPEAYTSTVNFLLDFALEIDRYQVNVELKKQEKILLDLNRKLDKLKSDNDRYHKAIEKAEKMIVDSKASIEQNVVDQEKMKTSIQDQKKVVKTVTEQLNSIGK